MAPHVPSGVLRADMLCMLLLLALACLFFAPAVFGGQIMLPTDNLLLLPPWKDAAQQLDPGFVTPHNRLISDLILQNYGWKRYLADSLRHGEVPLWNPYLQGGTPFLASGQYGVLYPLGLLFVVLPVERAYGYFAALHLFIAGSGIFWLARLLSYRRSSSLVAAFTFMFAQRLITSAVWPQMLSAMSWIGWILLAMELALRGVVPNTSAPSHHSVPPTRWNRGVLAACLGAVAVAMQILAGHLEISFYVLFTAIVYGLLRVGSDMFSAYRHASVSRVVRTAIAQIALLALLGGGGLALSAAQLLPFSEAIGQNFREGSVTYDEVKSWAMPTRQFIAFVIPDFYGNPSQHAYFDIFSWQWHPLGPDAQGRPTDPPQTVSWGAKDYVEGASYVGILPLLLAVIAVCTRWRSRWVVIFGAIGILALLLATGSPLYRPLFLYVPGFSQVHSAFRWVYIYGLAVSILAAIGLDAILDRLPSPPTDQPGQSLSQPGRTVTRSIGWLCLAGATGAMLVLAGGYLVRSAAAQRLQSSLARNEALARNFTDGHELFAFLYAHIARGAILFAISCALLWAGMAWLPARRSVVPRAAPLFGGACAVLVAIDLFLASAGFHAYTPARLLQYTPPVVAFLRQQPGPFRIISYKNDSLLTADTGMIWRIEDARGYDTIVLKRYAAYMNLIEPQTMLLPYSRVKGLDQPASLQNPLLNLLNVRYILTKETLPGPQYVQRFEDQGGTRVYENTAVLSRAFVVHAYRSVMSPTDALASLKEPGFDPRQTVILETSDAPTMAAPPSPAPEQVAITRSSPQSSEVRVHLTGPGYVVVSDVNFPGWIATVDGLDTPIVQADAAFRAVPVSSGDHTILFRYRPRSFRTGLLISSCAALTLMLALVAALWTSVTNRTTRFGQGEHAATRRIAKNSLALMAGSLCNKVMDFGLIIWATTVIGPEGIGRYYFAVAVIGFLGTIGDYGLGTLLLRDVSADTTRTGRYYANLLLIRMCITVALLGVIWGITGPLAAPLQLTHDTSTALWLLIVSFFPGATAATASAVIKAYERMEYVAFIDVAANLLRVALSVALLLADWGIVGLAIAALIVNVFNGVIYTGFVHRLVPWRALRIDLAFCRWAITEATPLMVNQLLNIFFFRVDVLLLKPLTSDLVVGYYGIAYKFIDGLGFISSYVTQALFPMLARSARDSREVTKQATVFGLRVLMLLALPIAAGTVILAGPIVRLFYRPEMAPAIPALQVLVLFLPFSFLNGLLQYVLIALGRQRLITVGYIIACMFNVAANLLAIHYWSYLGAAGVTVASELVLLVPFTWLLRRDLGALPWGTIFVRPALAALIMAVAVSRCHGVLALALPVGMLSYSVALGITGGVTREDFRLLWSITGRGGTITPQPAIVT